MAKEAANQCREWMDRIRTGSREEINRSFAQLQDEFDQPLRKFVYSHFFSQGEIFVDELVHQTWIKVWKNIQQCRGESWLSILAWITKISLNLGYNLVRDSKKFDELLQLDVERSDDGVNASSWEETNFFGKEKAHGGVSLVRPTEDQAMMRDLMQKWLDQLTKQQRKVFVLCLDGYSKSEIATIMKISRPCVSQYIQEIRSKNVGLDW